MMTILRCGKYISLKRIAILSGGIYAGRRRMRQFLRKISLISLIINKMDNTVTMAIIRTHYENSIRFPGQTIYLLHIIMQ